MWDLGAPFHGRVRLAVTSWLHAEASPVVSQQLLGKGTTAPHHKSLTLMMGDPDLRALFFTMAGLQEMKSI